MPDSCTAIPNRFYCKEQNQSGDGLRTVSGVYDEQTHLRLGKPQVKPGSFRNLTQREGFPQHVGPLAPALQHVVVKPLKSSLRALDFVNLSRPILIIRVNGL
jgi:hypothetical protein